MNVEYGTVRPADEYNRALVSDVHPADWKNPEPAERYNLVVIGAGTAGLVCAAGAAGLGAKVALIERHLLGGDCLNVGCVPSKAVIKSAEAAYLVSNAAQFGIGPVSGGEADFAGAMERMRRVRSKISGHDSAMRMRGLGIDVFFGEGKFVSGDTVEVDGVGLRFRKAVIATGARAAKPPVEGLEETGFLTNETVFSLTERPGRLAVFGAGPLGCELAQAFCRLGCEVTLIHRSGHLLSREDPDAANIVARAMQQDGIDIRLDATVKRVSRNSGGKLVHVSANGKEEAIGVDEILIGAGRAPNVEELNLESAGVEYDKREGVKVDDHLRTTNRRIFGAGDVCLKYKFTHTADASARIVIQNALFGGRKKFSDLVIPWCTYTDPAIAHVGMYEKDAREKGIEVDTYEQGFSEVDRAVTEGREDGLIKIHVKRGSDKILGATIVAANAGDMISEITLAMVSGIGLGRISRVIHSYPTQAEAIKHMADAYNRTRLTPLLKKVFGKWLAWNR